MDEQTKIVTIVLLSEQKYSNAEKTLIVSELSTFIAAPVDYSSVYSGLWGYSCILSMAAVSWAQFPFSA